MLRMAFITVAVFGMCLLLIPAAGIVYGLTRQHVFEPIYARITDPGPLYVDDPRCCR